MSIVSSHKPLRNSLSPDGTMRDDVGATVNAARGRRDTHAASTLRLFLSDHNFITQLIHYVTNETLQREIPPSNPQISHRLTINLGYIKTMSRTRNVSADFKNDFIVIL